jgi:hypothetical protein
MMPMYHQQQQQASSFPNGFQFGYQQPQQYFGLDPNNIPINWQQNRWSGGGVNGQPMPLHPPPFHYPMNMSTWTDGSPSNYVGRNQGPPSHAFTYANQGRSETSRMPRRGILRQTGQRNTPTQRRLVNFMPERFQQRAPNNNTPEYRGMSVTVPVQVNNRGQRSTYNSVQQQERPKKTADKAHRDTLRRRERRQKGRVFSLENNSEELGRLNDNRFNLLSETDEEEETNNDDLPEASNRTQAMEQQNVSKQGKPSTNTRNNAVSRNKQVNTTTEVPINSEHVVSQNKKARGNNQRQVYLETEQETTASSENELGNEEGSPSTKDKQKTKTYLQRFKILAYLKDRVEKDRILKNEFKPVFNEICTYAETTMETYDIMVHHNYEAQVWQQLYDLGREKNHWAKEIVNITHTREAKTNIVFCEKKISYFTTSCFDANKLLTRHMKEILSVSSVSLATAAVKRAHDVMLDYIKEATQGLSKMSLNRIRRASAEKDEWEALKAFEDVASEQQKMYAKTFCKPTMKSYHKKKKNLDLVAAHISYDIIPKILPKYEFNLPMDGASLSSDQSQENKESIEKLSRDFRLKATELYLKIAKEEFNFQNERLDQILADFPQDRDEIASTQLDPISSDDNHLTDGVFTQRSQPERQMVTHKGLELFKKYVEIALKRALLETEREVLFLAERGVKETPFVIKEARDLNPLLRKDFVLQA